MGFRERFSQKSRHVSHRLTEKYREHVGEELVKKQDNLEKRRESLDERERRVRELEQNQNKYYRIPRWVIDIPVACFVLAIGYWAYGIYAVAVERAELENESSKVSITKRFLTGSDDYQSRRSAFKRGAESLIRRGACSPYDFKYMGGWVKSVNKGDSVYFTYCGGMEESNRVYLDVSSGRTFKSYR